MSLFSFLSIFFQYPSQNHPTLHFHQVIDYAEDK